MCHHVVQELKPGKTCGLLCHLPQHYEAWETICICLSDSKVSQYLGAGKAAFVCGSCTFRLNRFDTIRQEYEAVKEDLEVQKRGRMTLWQSHPRTGTGSATATPTVCTSQSDSTMDKLAVWVYSRCACTVTANDTGLPNLDIHTRLVDYSWLLSTRHEQGIPFSKQKTKTKLA